MRKHQHLSDAYFNRIEDELHWTILPNPEFFEGEEREKLLAAQARGEPVTVRIMLTHHQAIRETLDRLIALEDAKIAAERKRRE